MGLPSLGRQTSKPVSVSEGPVRGQQGEDHIMERLEHQDEMKLSLSQVSIWL